MKIKIHVLQSQTEDDGIGVKLFISEEKLHKYMAELMEGDVDALNMEVDDGDNIVQLISAGKIMEAWDLWIENVVDPFDNYCIYEEEITTPAESLSVVKRLCDALKRCITNDSSVCDNTNEFNVVRIKHVSDNAKAALRDVELLDELDKINP